MLLPRFGASSPQRKLLLNELKHCSRLALNHTQMLTSCLKNNSNATLNITGSFLLSGRNKNGIFQHQLRFFSQSSPPLSVQKNHEPTEQSTSPQNTKIQPPLTLRENIYTIPNMLTFTRLGTAPLIGYLITQSNPTLTLSVFAYSCITDLLDGYIARKYNMGSVLGSVIDPMADKLLMVIATVALSVSNGMPMYLAGVILGRDVMLATMALYIRYISLPLPKTFKRYWDFSIPSVEVHPTMISKVNTALQMLYIGAAIVKPVLLGYVTGDVGLMLEDGMSWFGMLVCGTTLWSGASYLFGANKFKILNRK